MGENTQRTTPPPVHSLPPFYLPEGDTKTCCGTTFHTFASDSDDVCSVTLVWKGGGVDAGLPGELPMALSLMNEGNARMDADSVADLYDFNGATVSASSREHASQLSVIGLSSRMADVLPVVTECVLNPLMPENVVDAAIARTVKKLQVDATRVKVRASHEGLRMIMGENHPLCRFPSPESVSRFTGQGLREVQKAVCLGGRMPEVYLAGKIDRAVESDVERMVRSIGEASGGEKVELVHHGFVAEAPGERRVKLEGSLQSAVYMTFPAVARSHPDYTGLRFAVMALGGYFGSRLMSNIREDKGYTYGISANLLGYVDGSYVGISSEQDTSYTSAVVEETLKEIAAMTREPIGEEEMERVRSFALSQLAMVLDTVFDVASYRMMESTTSLPHDYFNRMQSTIREITPERVMELVARYLRPEEARIAIAE